MLSREETVVRNSVHQLLPSRAISVLRICEGLCTVGIGLGIYFLYVGQNITLVFARYTLIIIVGTLIYQALSHKLRANDVTTRIGDASHTARAFGAWTLTFAILLAVAFVFKISELFSRVWMVSWFLGTGGSILMLRLILGQWLIKRAEQGQFALRTIIIGNNRNAKQLAELLLDRDDYELALLGFIDAGDGSLKDDRRDLEVLGDVNYLIQMIRAGLVDQVIICLPGSQADRLYEIMNELSLTPVKVCVMPFHSIQDIRDRSVTRVSGVPMVEMLTTPISDSARAAKSMEDIILGSLMLLFVAPLMLLIAAAIKLDSRGPVFFRQKRQGYNEQLIEVWKFRTMFENAADFDCLQQTTSDDPRVTRVGRFLRRSSLDELPQLFNVLNGTMSLVGPRPHAPETKAAGELFVDVVDRYAARHRVKPGITGLAQVNGWRGETDSLEKINRRVEYDLYYIDHWSVWLDLWILLKTLWIILKGENAY